MAPLIPSGKRVSGLFLFLVTFVNIASAQGLTCAGTAVTPLVRAEGLAERLGDVVLECSGGAPGAVIKENLTVFLSVNNTNQLLTNGVLDAQLTVDTGAGPVPSVSPRPA